MKPIAQVFLFGSLRKKGEGHENDQIQCTLPSPIPLKDFLQQLLITPEEVQMVMVNHRAVSPDSLVHPGDRIAIFPKEYAIFADWKNLRAQSSRF